MRGRKPRSAGEKIARGETRPSRVNYQEPDPPAPRASELKPPAGLFGAGLNLWNAHAKTMTDAGQLRSTDMPLFLQHCRTATDIDYWQREKAKRDLDRSDRLSIQRTITTLKSLFVREAAELGMSSVSRSRVKTVTKPPVEKPKHERFFGKGGLTVVRGGRK